MNELQKLYELLKREGYYTKSYQDFEKRYSDDDMYREKVYNVVSRDGFYSKNKDEFFKKYSTSQPEVVESKVVESKVVEPLKKEPVKKKDITVSSSADGSLVSQSSKDTDPLQGIYTPVSDRFQQLDASISQDIKAGETKERSYYREEERSQAKKDYNREQYEKMLQPEAKSKPLKPQEFLQAVSDQENRERIKELDKEYVTDQFTVNDSGTPSILSSEFDDSVSKRISDLPDVFEGKNEEYLVPQMNRTFGEYGFRFEETGFGNSLLVNAENGKSIQVDLDQVGELQRFISDNKDESEFVKNRLLNFQNPVDGFKKLGIPEKKIQKIQYVKDKQQIIDAADNISNIAYGLQKEKEANEEEMLLFQQRYSSDSEKDEEYYESLSNILSKKKDIELKESLLKERGSEIDKIAGEYAITEAVQGSLGAGLTSEFLGGFGSISAEGVNIATDLLISLGGSGLIEPTLYESKRKEVASELGPNASKEDIDSKTLDFFKKKIKYGEELENDYSKFAKEHDYLNSGLVDNSREGLVKLVGSESTTKAYRDQQKENKLTAALYGVVNTLPAIIGASNKATGFGKMFLMGADAVNKEMQESPEFDDISENEKLLVSLPVGIASGILNQIGFSNAIAQKGLLNGLVARALNKSTSSTTAKSFANFIKQDVENAMSRGLLTLGAGGLAEFESGALEYIGETSIKQVYNLSKGKKMFETPETFTEYITELADAGIQELIGGAIMLSPKAVNNAISKRDMSNLPGVTFDAFKEIANDDYYKSMYVTKLKSQVASGQITSQEAESSLETLNKNIGILPQIPKDLSNRNQRKALELLSEKQEILKEIEGKDESLVKKKKDRISNINLELESLGSETVAEEVKVEELAPETVAEEVKEIALDEPTEEQLIRDIDNGDVITKTYTDEKDIPDVYKEKTKVKNSIRKQGTVKIGRFGKETPIYIVTVEKSLSDYYESNKKTDADNTVTKEVAPETVAEEVEVEEAVPETVAEEVETEEVAPETVAEEVEVEEVALDEDSIEQGKKEVESISTGQLTTTKPVKIFKGIGGKKDLTGSRINAHEGVNGIFSAVDQDLANEYSGDEGVSEVVLPEGTTVEVVEIDGTGMGVNEYRKAEVDAINNSKAQVVKLRTVDGVMKKGAKKQDQYIIKDESIMNELSPRSTTSVNEEIKVLESKFSKKEEAVEKVDLFESLLDSAIKATKLDRTKLQSNPLGIAQPILHESLKIVRATYKATKSSAKAIKKGYDFLVNKGYKGSQKEYSDYLDTLNRPSVDEVRSFAKENKLSDKSVREYLKKFNYTDAEIKVAMKKAPSVSKVLGKTEKKVTVNEMSALKDQIRLESKAARQSVKAYKDISKGIKAKITALSKKGVITASMSKAMIRKVLSTNMMNEKMVSNLVSYIDNVFTKAGLADKINTANKRRKTALTNLKSKVGPSKELNITLRELFSIDPSLIPLSKFDKYSELLDQFGEKKRVLKIEQEITEALNNAYDILNSVEEVEVSNQETTKSKELNETIEKDLDGYLNGIVKDKIDVEKIENKDSKSLAEFFNSITKEDLEGLISKDKDGDNNYSLLENIKELKETMKNGYFPKLANDLKNTIEENRSERELTDIVKNKVKKSFLAVGFSRAYGKIKSFFMTKQSEKNMFLQMLRGNVTTAMDDLLGNFNSTKIYDNTIGKLAEAFSRYQVDVAENVQAKLKIADSLLFRSKIPTIQRQDGKVKKSRYKIQMYRLQREFLANPDNKQVSSAIDFIDATIKAIRDGETDIYSEEDAKILEDLKKEFSKDGQIDMKAVENNFTANEKKALKLIDEVNESIEEKYLWTANVIRGVGAKPIRNYVHHNVISNKGRAVSESESLSEKFNSFSNASTEAKTIRERTAGAKAINFDPITSTSLGARETLLDYHMTDAYRVVKGTLKKMMKNKEDFNDYQRKAIKAIESLSNELVENVFGEQILTNTFLDTLMREAVKVGYQNALASVPRAFSELSSNISYVMFKPSQIVKGIKTFGAFSYGSEGADAMKNLRSSEVMRLYDEASITSRMTDSSLVNEKRRGNRATKSMFLQKLSYLSQFTGLKQTKMLTDKISEKLISTPDLAVARPFWFGSFTVKFKELTGESLSNKDMEAIAKGDSKYLGTKYKEAVDLSSNFADSELIAMANSKNPFNSVAKNMKKSDEGLMNTYRVMNSYMASFMINEYSTGRKATLALFYKGDMTKKQAAATLAGLVSRQVIYLTILDIAYKAFDSLISGEEGAEEEEEDLVDKIFKNTLSSVASMVFTRNLGNVTTAVSNHIIERANKEYLGFLRGGEDYDPYKHSFTFNRIKERDLQTKTLSEIILGTAAGPLSPQLKGAENILKAYQNRGKSTKPKKVEKWQDYLDTRLMIEGLGGIGLLPLYKDIRRSAEKDLRKKY